MKERPKLDHGRLGRILRIAAGAALWTAIVAFGWTLLDRPGESRQGRALAHVRSWLFGQRVPVVVEFPQSLEAALGDPVFFSEAAGALTLVGEVRALLGPDGAVLPARHALVRAVRCELYASGHPGLTTASRFVYVTVPDTASWVFHTLLPPERIRWLAHEWNRTLVAHREELFAAISPVLQGVVRDLQVILTEDLPPALAARSAELAKIGARLEEDIVRREFLPLVESEILPILTARARPTLDAIGHEILAQLPVWSFTWRFLYQSLPITRDDYLRTAWEHFVEEEVVAILRNHVDDFFGALRDVVAQAAESPQLGAAFRRGFDQLLSDRALQHELRLAFQETILDNPRFHDAMLRHWESETMAQAIDRLSVFMGPLLARLAEAVLGSRGGGITPEFARVLRTQILDKDRRWLRVTPGEESGERIPWGFRFEGRPSTEEAEYRF